MEIMEIMEIMGDRIGKMNGGKPSRGNNGRG